MTASRSCCRFVGCTSMMRISRSTTSQRCSIGFRSGDCGGHLSKVNSLSCSRNQSEMIWALWHGALSCWKDPFFHVIYAKLWPHHLNVAAEIETHQTRQRFSNLLLSNFGEPVLISAAVAHLLQGSTCCAFRDVILHTLVVTSGYLSYCCLSIISNSLSILLWHQQGIFIHTTAAHWIFSIFLTHSL